MSAIRSYRPKGTSVKAIQITEANAEEARLWCSGAIERDRETNEFKGLRVPTLNGVELLGENGYLCWTKDSGFFVLAEKEFENDYEAVRNTSKKD